MNLKNFSPFSCFILLVDTRIWIHHGKFRFQIWRLVRRFTQLENYRGGGESLGGIFVSEIFDGDSHSVNTIG